MKLNTGTLHPLKIFKNKQILKHISLAKLSKKIVGQHKFVFASAVYSFYVIVVSSANLHSEKFFEMSVERGTPAAKLICTFCET